MNKNLLEEILKKLKKKGCDEADIVFAEQLSILHQNRIIRISILIVFLGFLEISS